MRMGIVANDKKPKTKPKTEIELPFSPEDVRRGTAPATPESCGSCRYYLQFPEDDEDDDEDDDDDGYILEGEEDPEDRETGPEEDIVLTGCCRRYPPVPLLQGIREFPAVSNEHDWCGEYAPAR